MVPLGLGFESGLTACYLLATYNLGHVYLVSLGLRYCFCKMGVLWFGGALSTSYKAHGLETCPRVVVLRGGGPSKRWGLAEGDEGAPCPCGGLL